MGRNSHLKQLFHGQLNQTQCSLFKKTMKSKLSMAFQIQVHGFFSSTFKNKIAFYKIHVLLLPEVTSQGVMNSIIFITRHAVASQCSIVKRMLLQEKNVPSHFYLFICSRVLTPDAGVGNFTQWVKGYMLFTTTHKVFIQNMQKMMFKT